MNIENNHVEKTGTSAAHKNFASKLTMILTVFFGSGFFVTAVGWYFSYESLDIEKAKLELEQEQHEQLKADYEKSRHSELSLSYVTEVGADKPKLCIKNDGNGFADSIWLSQKFYLVDSSNSVYECDLPRYAYVLYNGSDRKMFSLSPEEDTIFVFWPNCFMEFWGRLKREFSGRLIMRWQLDFSSANSSVRQTKFFYFLIDEFHRPIRPIDKTGAAGLVQHVEWYEKHSFRQVIKWIGHFNEYFLNPKQDFYVDEEGVMRSLPDNTDSLNITKRILIGGPEDFRPMSKAGYGAIVWNCDMDGTISKGLKSSPLPLY